MGAKVPRHNMTKEEIFEQAQQNQGEQLSILRDERCIPHAQFVLKHIANSELLPKALGARKEEDFKAFAKDVQLAVITELVEKAVLLKDIGYIFRLCHQAIDTAQEMMQTNINENTMRAETFKWGCPPGEITVAKLHEVLLQISEEPVKDTESTEPVDNPVEPVDGEVADAV